MRKKIPFRRRLLLLLAAIYSLTASAQKASVSGVVQNDKGQPLAGVTVIVKNAKTNFTAGTQSDTSGIFNFSKLPSGGPYSFSFSAIGFESQSMSGYHIKPEATVLLSLKLTPQSASLNEVVVVGYGTQKREDLTGAVTQVSGEVLENRSLPNVTQGLQGVVPNLNLVPLDGKPIQSPVYNIRGTTSIGQGGNALVLIDNVQGDPSLLNPDDIASVTVLKDAASASIYGARAAYGVVLITTKSANRDKFSLTYSSDYALKKPALKRDLVSNGYQYASNFASAWEAWYDYSQVPQNINKTQPFSNAWLTRYQQHDADPTQPKWDLDQNGNYEYYGNTDWYALLYKNHNTAIDQNLALTGGTGKANYYVSGRYYSQDGLFRYNSDNYHMYNLTAKGTIQAFPWLQINNTTQFTSRFYHNPLNTEEGGSIWNNLGAEGHPSSLLYNPDGTFTYSSVATVGDFVYGKNGINLNDQVIKNTASFVAKVIGSSFRIKGDITFQNTTSTQKEVAVQVPYETKPGVTLYVGTGTNFISMVNNQTNYLANNIYGEYEKTFGQDHYFKALAGYNYEQSVLNSSTVQRNGVIYPNATDLSLALGQSITTSGGYDKWAIQGGFGRLNYAFRDKYLLEVNGRYDGSSKFPSNQRYGFFPSASAGWRISKEGFWKVSPKAVTDLKVRASYGSLGNGNIASYTYQNKFTITQSNRVLLGVYPQTTSAPPVLPKGLTWETATTADLGLDATFLNNKLTFTGDVYRRKTTNMFTVSQTLPAVFGATAPKGNYADLTTIGWEASIAWKDGFKIGNRVFHYSVGFWMSDYSATVDKYINITKNLGDYYVGEKLGEIWGLTNDGYWTDANYMQASKSQTLYKPSITGTYMPGDIKFKDLNHDGVINNGDNTATNPGDMKRIGNNTPRYSFGSNISADYDNFFVSFFFQGVGKEDYWPGKENASFWGQYNRPYQYLWKSQVGHIWSESNPNAYWPRYRGYVASAAGGELTTPQTKYLQNVAYVRLKNIQIGYDLPKGWASRMHMTNMRLYATGENLWTYSPFYKHTHALDVENIGQSDVILTGTSNSGNGNNYPILKSMAVGLSATF